MAGVEKVADRPCWHICFIRRYMGAYHARPDASAFRSRTSFCISRRLFDHHLVVGNYNDSALAPCWEGFRSEEELNMKTRWGRSIGLGVLGAILLLASYCFLMKWSPPSRLYPLKEVLWVVDSLGKYHPPQSDFTKETQ